MTEPHGNTQDGKGSSAAEDGLRDERAAMQWLGIDSDPDSTDCFDMIQIRIDQASAIVALMGHIQECSDAVPDSTVPFASWAARDLLEQAKKIAGYALLQHRQNSLDCSAS